MSENKASSAAESGGYLAAAGRYGGGMEYRRSGRSGVKMSAISLGFWHNFGGSSDFATAKAMMERAFDRGITCFDLANNYGPPYGSAETTFGRLMDLSFRPYRDEMFVTTKAGYDMWDGPYGNWGSRKYLLASLDQSLSRMRLDYVDLFYSHRYDPETPLEETLQALVDAVRQGKALYAGISRYPAEAAKVACDYLAARDVPCLCYQGRINLFDRADAAPGGVLEQLSARGVGYVGFSPLAQGLLSNRYLDGIPAGSRMYRREHLTPERRTEAVVRRIRALNAVAAGRGEALSTMALAWALRRPGVTSLIVGTSSVAQLDENLRALASPDFAPDELAAIESALSMTEESK